MQKSFKRTLSLLLAVLMVMTLFTALPLTVSAAVNEPEIVGTSITLNGAIGLNFYVKENGNNSYKANFEYDSTLLSGDSKPTTNLNDDAVYDKTKNYRIYTINLFAKQMTEQITFSVSDTETKTKKTSVREYAEKIISGGSDQTLTKQGYSADKIAKAKDLCKAMLNYGAQAQTEFNYKTDDLANKDYSDYTAPALNAESIEDIDYSDSTGAWITESSRVYQFVNTYGWEHVYVHYLFDKEKTVLHEEEGYQETVPVFCDDKVEEIFPSNYPSNYTYTNSDDGSDISNGKRIYIFEPTQKFKFLVFTDTPGLLDGEMIGRYAYFYNIYSSETTAGWKNWKNWKNGEVPSCDTISGTPVHFIDFVNVPKWSTVSVDVTTNQWDSDQGENVDVSQNYAMKKLSEKAADGSDVYRFILPEMFTSSSNVTLRFTNGSDATLQTTYSTYYNIHRYTPSQRTDKFEKFGMTYSGSSIGLLQKIGYSLFFSALTGFYSADYKNIKLYCGEERLDSGIDQQYRHLGYSCYSITDIAPSDLLKPITITFKWYDSDWKEQSKDYQFTVCNYIKRALMLDDSNNNNIQLKKTVTALVDYAEKADAYFKAN